VPSYYLIETKRGRWGHKKYVYTAFLEVILPNKKKRVWRVKQEHVWTKTPPRADSSWRLTKGHMKTMYANTKPSDWRIQILRKFDGRVDGVREYGDRSWGTPQFSGSVTVLDDLRVHDQYYDYLSPMGYIHCWSNSLGTYNLRPRFSMRLLPKVPKAAIKKAQKMEIPRFGVMKPINVMMLYERDLNSRLSLLRNAEYAIINNLKVETAPSRIKKLKERKKTVREEIGKVVRELENREFYKIRRFAFQTIQELEGKPRLPHELPLSLSSRHYRLQGKQKLFKLIAVMDSPTAKERIQAEGKTKGFNVRTETRKRTPKFRIYMRKKRKK
jgi:hypothetical protein